MNFYAHLDETIADDEHELQTLENMKIPIKTPYGAVEVVQLDKNYAITVKTGCLTCIIDFNDDKMNPRKTIMSIIE